MKSVKLFSGTLILALLTSCFGGGIREPHSLTYDSIAFNSLANKILTQNQVFEMDDLTRHFKRVNNVNVSFANGDDLGDTTSTDLYKALDSLNINKNLVFEIKSELENTSLREFYKSGDSILFRVDGFLSSSWGFFYSRQTLSYDTLPFSFKGHTVHFIENINSNWKKVGMRP